MAIPLTRVTQLLFGSTGPVGDFGVFGSKAAGTPTFSQDPVQIQSLPAFEDGWGESIIGNYEPPLEDMNSLFLLAFRQIAYIFQQGVSEYDPNINYFIGSLAMQNGVLYISQIGSNRGNNPSTDNGTNWIQGIGGANGGVPIGTILNWGGPVNAIPTGYLYGNGQAVSRTTYAKLFSIIGITYGAGNGTTTFNLPNGQGNVLVGYLSGDPNFGTIGGTGGEVTHTLTIPEMPSHTHPCGFPNTAQGGNNAVQGGGAGTDPTGLTGGDSPHNNVQPFLVIGGIIIKY